MRLYPEPGNNRGEGWRNIRGKWSLEHRDRNNCVEWMSERAVIFSTSTSLARPCKVGTERINPPTSLFSLPLTYH